MDLGKDQAHAQLRQLPGPHQEGTYAPEVIGTRCLRNREQLRKRKAEAQEKQTSQWLFRDQIKHKRQRTGKGNEGGRKRKFTELKMAPQPQIEKEMLEKAQAPTEQETESPRSVTQALSLETSEEKAVAVEHSPEIRQDSIMLREHSSEYQDTAVLQDRPANPCQGMAEPDLSPGLCQDTAVLQDRPAKLCQGTAELEDLSPRLCQGTAGLQDRPANTGQGMAEPEGVSPRMCRDTAVLQDHPSKTRQELAGPEDLSPKICQEIVVPQALPSKISEAIAEVAGCSSEASPKRDVPESSTPETYRNPAEPEEYNSDSDQGTAQTESSFSKTQELAMPTDLSAKTYQETVELEHFPQRTYKESTLYVPKAPSHEAIQEAAGPEEYSPGIDQEAGGPGDLSTKAYQNGVPKECFPGRPQGQGPEALQEDAKAIDTSPPEMREKPKPEEPEIPAILNVSQEAHPEHDVYSYVLF